MHKSYSNCQVTKKDACLLLFFYRQKTYEFNTIKEKVNIIG